MCFKESVYKTIQDLQIAIFHGRRDKEDHTAMQPQDHVLHSEKVVQL